jgi:hypothetical protein
LLLDMVGKGEYAIYQLAWKVPVNANLLESEKDRNANERTKAQVQHEATVGMAEHGNSAVLVTVAPGGDLLDRRHIALIFGMPTHPYHHEESWTVTTRAMNVADSPSKGLR